MQKAESLKKIEGSILMIDEVNTEVEELLEEKSDLEEQTERTQ